MRWRSRKDSPARKPNGWHRCRDRPAQLAQLARPDRLARLGRPVRVVEEAAVLDLLCWAVSGMVSTLHTPKFGLTFATAPTSVCSWPLPAAAREGG